ncbi:type II toxin-antitoxin system VapC family toxin [Microbacterium trichothecenolyticum]|uniref:Type II toxin-antitoxin system VapC family toxin n=1 Tax=Microbacterium ureisolvens TaxID=2781186 RepID=A0ABS7I0B7_9MICO|nr:MULTISPECIES: type II toxin-antitoxin system VapC family toxin [Microbacterium]MBW9111099.1 type II toxin-antitoxin system VapC family toxin [Microbacterium ureisolvens]MBW9122240.1 type II toxin-antitoxin system VapC family toxin [Microbacterium trichothecenolyticum]
MRAYFDSSAFVPLLIDEPSTGRCTMAWTSSIEVISSVVTFVEVHAALATAVRSGRLHTMQHRNAIAHFEVIWEAVTRVGVDDAMLQHAATLTASHRLRGYDALQCATAWAAASDDLLAVSGDRDLVRAWADLGITTFDTTGDS